jgi:hypothetical protein
MRTRTLTCALAALALAATLCACAAAPQPAAENAQRAAVQATPATAQESPAAAAVAASPDPATQDVKSSPRPADVRAALERTYKGAVAFDEHAPNIAVVGDFNGDGSEDLMVEARPAPGRINELNDELSNWIVSDPRTVRPPDPRDFDPHQGVQKLAPRTSRPRIEPTDALLIVVHGYKEQGWHNPEALQTFLLKNVAGTELRAEARAGAQAAARKGTPRLVGDVLHERLEGEQGFLYWTGATYGWFH